MYKYETHLHTSPVSRCARADAEESIAFYKQLGYDGVFVTNHFDAYCSDDAENAYAKLIEFHFSDYEKAVEIGKSLGIKVFFGAEISYQGTDFLVYGLDKEWFLTHPEITEMPIREKLAFMTENGALIIHAHPFREAGYIDHIRLFPRNVHGVEIINACRTQEENGMASQYAEHYSLLKFAGSDNHVAGRQRNLAGIGCVDPIDSVAEFIDRVKNQQVEIFTLVNE